MKRNIFLIAPMCCFALAVFSFFIFVLFYGDIRNAEKTPWDEWYEKVLLPSFDFREQLAKDHGFSVTVPPSFFNDRIIGMHIGIEKPEQAALILRDLAERKRLSPELKDETFGVNIAVEHPHDGWVSEQNSIPPILLIRTMLPAPGRTEFQGIYHGRTSDVVIGNGIGSVSRAFAPDAFYHSADGSGEAEAFIRTLAEAPPPTEQEIADWRKQQKAGNSTYEEMTSNRSSHYGKFYAAHYCFEILPNLFFATFLDFICTIILFAFCYQYREMRGRLLPLWLLTMLHTILFPLMNCVPFDKAESSGRIVELAFNIISAAYFLAPPVLVLFVLIYAIALWESNRMNRRIGLASCVFAANFFIQGFFLFLAWVHGQGG